MLVCSEPNGFGSEHPNTIRVFGARALRTLTLSEDIQCV